ncbi:IS2 transposase TnpB [compost metagenome]
MERLFETVEAVLADPAMEFLRDNGETHIATETRAIALARVRQPINTPVYSPQLNGMAESFKRDYEARIDRHDARAVVKQTLGASNTK